jgi:hypothetical protein
MMKRLLKTEKGKRAVGAGAEMNDIKRRLEEMEIHLFNAVDTGDGGLRPVKVSVSGGARAAGSGGNVKKTG